MPHGHLLLCLGWGARLNSLTQRNCRGHYRVSEEPFHLPISSPLVLAAPSTQAHRTHGRSPDDNTPLPAPPDQAAGIRFISFRNEQAAGYAAAAAGFLTGAPGVLLTVSGPGAVHGIAGLSHAQANCWPLLMLSGSAEQVRARRPGQRQTLRVSTACGAARAEAAPALFASSLNSILHVPPCQMVAASGAHDQAASSLFSCALDDVRLQGNLEIVERSASLLIVSRVRWGAGHYGVRVLTSSTRTLNTGHHP